VALKLPDEIRARRPDRHNQINLRRKASGAQAHLDFQQMRVRLRHRNSEIDFRLRACAPVFLLRERRRITRCQNQDDGNQARSARAKQTHHGVSLSPRFSGEPLKVNLTKSRRRMESRRQIDRGQNPEEKKIRKSGSPSFIQDSGCWLVNSALREEKDDADY
jgi:hypothetical protein